MQTGVGCGGWLGELVYGPRPCSAAERCSLDLSRRRLDRAPLGGPVPSREWGNGPDRHQLLCWPRFLCFTHSARSAYGAPILLQAFPIPTHPWGGLGTQGRRRQAQFWPARSLQSGGANRHRRNTGPSDEFTVKSSNAVKGREGRVPRRELVRAEGQGEGPRTARWQLRPRG